MERFLGEMAKKLISKANSADSVFEEWLYLFLLSVLNNIVYAFYMDQKALGRWVWLEAFTFLLLSAVGVLLKIYLLIIPAFAVAVFLFTPYLRNILYLGTALAGYLSVLAAVMSFRMGSSSGFTAITTLIAFITGYGLVNTGEAVVSFFRKVKRVFGKIRIVLVLVLAVAVVLSSTNAFAFDPKHVEFYTYGGFDAIYNAFRFISLIFSDKSYKGLFFTVMALSLFFAGFRNYIQSLQGRQTGNILSWSMPVLIAFILYMALIVPKGQVTIYDTVLNKSADVGGIPIGITTAAGIASEVENGIIKIIDTTEVNPDLNYENSAGGVGVMAIMNMAMHGVRSNNVYLDRSLKRYIEDCVFYDLENPKGWTKLPDITDTTTSFVDVLEKAAHYHSIYTVYYDASNNAGETMTCYDAWQNLKPQLLNNNNFQSALENMCATVGVDTADTVALQHCRDVLTAYLEDLYDGKFSAVTSDAFSFIRQAYVASEIYNASVDADSSFLINYRIANAGMNVGMAFNTWIPTIRAVLIALGLSILPFLIIFLPTPFYGKIIGAIVGVFVFMVSWAMLDATVHRFLVGEAQTLFQSVVIHNVGYGAFLTMSTPLQHIMAMWGYVRSLAMGMAAIGAGIFTKVGAYGLQMAIGRLEGAVAGQASSIGEQATNPAEQGSLEKSIAISSAFSQKIAPSVTLQDIIRGEAGNMKRQIGQGIGLGPEALKTGETEGKMATGTANQIRNISRDTGQSVENIAAISTELTTETQVGEALQVNKNNPMAGARKIASTNAKVAAGGVLGWNALRRITGMSEKEISKELQIAKGIHGTADYNALKGAGFKNAEDYLAINELNQFRQNRGFVQLFEKAGLLSRNFHNESPEQQIKELAGAFDHLGSHPENISLDADLAHRLGLPEAGTYTIGMSSDGRYVQIVGKSGADYFVPISGGLMRLDEPIVNGMVTKPTYADIYGDVGEELSRLQGVPVPRMLINVFKGASGSVQMHGNQYSGKVVLNPEQELRTAEVLGALYGDKYKNVIKTLINNAENGRSTTFEFTGEGDSLSQASVISEDVGENRFFMQTTVGGFSRLGDKYEAILAGGGYGDLYRANMYIFEHSISAKAALAAIADKLGKFFKANATANQGTEIASAVSSSGSSGKSYYQDRSQTNIKSVTHSGHISSKVGFGSNGLPGAGKFGGTPASVGASYGTNDEYMVQSMSKDTVGNKSDSGSQTGYSNTTTSKSGSGVQLSSDVLKREFIRDADKILNRKGLTPAQKVAEITKLEENYKAMFTNAIGDHRTLDKFNFDAHHANQEENFNAVKTYGGTYKNPYWKEQLNTENEYDRFISAGVYASGVSRGGNKSPDAGTPNLSVEIASQNEKAGGEPSSVNNTETANLSNNAHPSIQNDIPRNVAVASQNPQPNAHTEGNTESTENKFLGVGIGVQNLNYSNLASQNKGAHNSDNTRPTIQSDIPKQNTVSTGQGSKPLTSDANLEKFSNHNQFNNQKSITEPSRSLNENVVSNPEVKPTVKNNEVKTETRKNERANPESSIIASSVAASSLLKNPNSYSSTNRPVIQSDIPREPTVTQNLQSNVPNSQFRLPDQNLEPTVSTANAGLGLNQNLKPTTLGSNPEAKTNSTQTVSQKNTVESLNSTETNAKPQSPPLRAESQKQPSIQKSQSTTNSPHMDSTHPTIQSNIPVQNQVSASLKPTQTSVEPQKTKQPLSESVRTANTISESKPLKEDTTPKVKPSPESGIAVNTVSQSIKTTNNNNNIPQDNARPTIESNIPKETVANSINDTNTAENQPHVRTNNNRLQPKEFDINIAKAASGVKTTQQIKANSESNAESQRVKSQSTNPATTTEIKPNTNTYNAEATREMMRQKEPATMSNTTAPNPSSNIQNPTSTASPSPFFQSPQSTAQSSNEFNILDWEKKRAMERNSTQEMLRELDNIKGEQSTENGERVSEPQNNDDLNPPGGFSRR